MNFYCIKDFVSHIKSTINRQLNLTMQVTVTHNLSQLEELLAAHNLRPPVGLGPAVHCLRELELFLPKCMPLVTVMMKTRIL